MIYIYIYHNICVCYDIYDIYIYINTCIHTVRGAVVSSLGVIATAVLFQLPSLGMIAVPVFFQLPFLGVIESRVFPVPFLGRD